MGRFDLVIQHGNVVIPYLGVQQLDIGIAGEKIVALEKNLDAGTAQHVIDASGLYVFPGAVDSHFHVGIYRSFEEDAASESASAASGGVTTILSYFRTGRDYLNKMGPYRSLLPELLDISSRAFITDYGYHLALFTEEHLEEVDWLVCEGGISTFKYYMFYKMLTLAGATPEANSYLMIDNPVDLGFLYRFMKKVGAANRRFRDAGTISLSIHCENPEIIRATQSEVKAHPSGNPLLDYSNARPPWQEELAINEVAIMARTTDCPVNLLHLSSRQAVEAGLDVRRRYPEVRFVLEATLHHLSLSNDMDLGQQAKVNPPLRSREDVDCLWRALLDGTIETVVSDHACATSEKKQGDLWTSMPGFGGTSLMFPVLITEGYHKRGLPLHRIAELSAANPARCHGLYPKKGTIAVGSDADLALVDIHESREVTLENLFTAQPFSPELGMTFRGWNQTTILRGQVIFANQQVVGQPGTGRFVKRPVALHYPHD